MRHPDGALAANETVDLHLHTRYSDGTWEPHDLFAALAANRISVASVVDHDQLAHLPEVMALGTEFGVTVIAGTEVTTEWRGLPAHLLCYAPLTTGFTDGALAAMMAETDTRMRANTRLVYEAALARGYRFPRQAELLARQGGEPIRAGDVAMLLLAHGAVESPAEAMAVVVDAGYQQARAPIAEAIAAAHAASGVCLIAHPGRGDGEIHRFTPAEIEALCADVPLDGVEVYYPTHTPAQVEAYAALARRRGLLTSAGSDSHGPSQRNPIAYPAALVAPLLERLGVVGG